MILMPFRGWRPAADFSSRIPSPPYDVFDGNEARELAADNPHSFLHVVKPEVDLDPEISPYDDRVYVKASENFQHMIDEGWFVRDEEPSLYVYRLVTEDHTQTGVVGLSAVDEYLDGRIKKHELTREAKETDRTRHIETLGANAGPVFIAHRPASAIETLVEQVTASEPAVDFTDSSGTRHMFWQVRDVKTRENISAAFAAHPEAYIADGHHRAAAAARVAELRRKKESREEGAPAAPSDYFLTVYFPSDQVRILDYNRVVKDLGGATPGRFISRLRESGFTVEERVESARPRDPGEFMMYMDGAWHRLLSPESWTSGTDAAKTLSVAVLADRLLEPILEITDVRNDPRIDFVGGSRGMEELEHRVREGRAAVAFAVYPTSMEALMSVADAGKVMPPKSTWFEPKLRSGMVVHSFDDEAL